MKLESLAFVYPMYNEEGNIGVVIGETMKIGPKVARNFEIIVVDDASTDKCGEIADALAEVHPEIRVFHHKHNKKLGGALRTGFSNTNSAYVLYMDSDLPIKMQDIPPAFELLKDADMVIGYRMNRSEGLRREILSWGYNRLIRLLFGLKVKDVNFSFKLFRRDILKDVMLGSEGSFIDAELLVETRAKGYKISEYGFNYYPRVAGCSTLSGVNIIVKILSEIMDYWKRADRKDMRFNRRPNPETNPDGGGE